jgi:hypothetical protein
MRCAKTATGRPLIIPVNPVTTRDHMRYYLRRAGLHVKDLGAVWNMHPVSAYRRFYHNRPWSPNYIEAFIEACKLDSLEAQKLRLLAAREAGWQLDLKYLKLVNL